ncbi:alpha-ketoacid dehydrogenase subunit beta [Mycobacterium antarcticum]|uniref:alpha-ketoacid dehydrogenase subunit beta n=1 Tax=Mycolicibacterium sp. TUM20984 TaxID=3023368 RepID=UPI0023A19D50|nr:transketolase C-terminal domain-containing protein [Mycolicibacterium sp. TUM20984]GLP83023.1 pyruvate dehydrogenase E1 component subunit beta [Mycolicibacterium sp. TUM20984]
MTDLLSPRDARNGSLLVAAALGQEMARDERVLLFGEDVAAMGGVFGTSRRLATAFGPDRVFDTPISETAFVGMAIGAAQAGLRPVVEVMFADFIGVCFDQIANQMAKNHYMSGGVVRVPLVLRTAGGCIGSAAQHSQLLTATLAHIPGLRVLAPGTPGGLQALTVAAVRSDDPVVLIEHKRLLKTRCSALPYNDVAPLGETIEPASLGSAHRVRGGTDVMLISYGWLVQECVLAADDLAARGLDVGVLDLRSLSPLDRETIVESAAAATRVLVVDEDYLAYGATAEVMAVIAEELGRDAPLMKRLAPTVSMPASRVLEAEVLIDAEKIVAAALALMKV